MGVVGGVPERLGWLHVAAVPLHSAIDVKCVLRFDCPGELRHTVIHVPAPQVLTLLSLTTKYAHTATALGMLVGTSKRCYWVYTSSNRAREHIW
jgi:hypothetical protein